MRFKAERIFFRIVPLFFVLCITVVGKAEGVDKLNNFPILQRLSFDIGTDYVAPSIVDELLKEDTPTHRTGPHSSMPVSLKYSFSFTDAKIKHYLAGGYQGLGIGLLNFGALEHNGTKISNRNIGYPIIAYVFQGGPAYRFNHNLSLDYEWNFGASFGWKPFNSYNKDFLLTVGSRVNAYINLNLGLSWLVSDRVSVFGGISFSHFSNGNTSWPNPGVNSLGLRFGATCLVGEKKKVAESVVADTLRMQRVNYDISLWGALRKRVYKGGEKPVLLAGHFVCAGIGFAPMYNFNRWWRLGGSFDIQWDESSDMKKNYIDGTTTEDIRFRHPSVIRQMSLGISAHGELRMPIFAVNVGLGYNLTAPPENKGFYQNITLKTYFGEKIFLNVGYQLRNFVQQSSLMLGLGMTI